MRVVKPAPDEGKILSFFYHEDETTGLGQLLGLLPRLVEGTSASQHLSTPRCKVLNGCPVWHFLGRTTAVRMSELHRQRHKPAPARTASRITKSSRSVDASALSSIQRPWSQSMGPNRKQRTKLAHVQCSLAYSCTANYGKCYAREHGVSRTQTSISSMGFPGSPTSSVLFPTRPFA